MHREKLVPELICSDINRSRSFYTYVLGFRILFERREERFAYLEREGAQLMIEQPQGRRFLAGDLTPPYGRGINLQIEATDVEGLYGALHKGGIAVFLPMEEKWYRKNGTELGQRQFIVQDPDGYLLRFFQDLGERDCRDSQKR
jgi:catechol 2,3-dioxygenase-like lactoylglutathione lyase family enzyme